MIKSVKYLKYKLTRTQNNIPLFFIKRIFIL